MIGYKLSKSAIEGKTAADYFSERFPTPTLNKTDNPNYETSGCGISVVPSAAENTLELEDCILIYTNTGIKFEYKSTDMVQNVSDVGTGSTEKLDLLDSMYNKLQHSVAKKNGGAVEGTMPSSQIWHSVCYGNDKFVAISYSTIFAYSTDGINWTKGNMPSNRDWYSVCYGNGMFVASVAYKSNVFAYSTDGINWTQGTMPSSHQWQSVCYGNGIFVAIAYNSDVFAYSTDGINWIQGTMPSSQIWHSVCYGNDKFVAISYGTIFAYSTDGINWTEGTMPISAYWQSVCYGNDKFVAIAYNSNIFAYSTDGINWTKGNMPSNRDWYSVCYGNGMFVASVTYKSNVFAVIYLPEGDFSTTNNKNIRVNFTSNLPEGVTATDLPASKDYFVEEDSTVTVEFSDPATTTIDTDGDYYYEFAGYTSDDATINTVE